MTGDLRISEFHDGDLASVISLWEQAGLTRPHNDPENEIRFAMEGPSSTILLGFIGADLAGSVMVGHDGHRGAIYCLAVDPARQKSGLGQKMLSAAEDWLRQRGVWKLNLLIRAENNGVRAFYEKCGYVEETRIAMARRIGDG